MWTQSFSRFTINEISILNGHLQIVCKSAAVCLLTKLTQEARQKFLIHYCVVCAWLTTERKPSAKRIHFVSWCEDLIRLRGAKSLPPSRQAPRHWPKNVRIVLCWFVAPMKTRVGHWVRWKYLGFNGICWELMKNVIFFCEIRVEESSLDF